MTPELAAEVVAFVMKGAVIKAPITVEETMVLRDRLVPELAPYRVEVFHRHTELVVQVFDGLQRVLTRDYKVAS